MDRVSIIVLFFANIQKVWGLCSFVFCSRGFVSIFMFYMAFFYWFEVGFIFHGVLIVVFASILYFFIKG